MANRNRDAKPLVHLVTIAMIIAVLALAAKDQDSGRFAKLAGGHAGPASEGAGEVALVGEAEHERHLCLRVVV